jgi:phosphoribosyl 1,2-cyclic phosphate phosphodiesterase
MTTRLTLLGTGTSHGVPMIACDCAVCRSDDPRDRRSRTSAVFSFAGDEGTLRHVLIDTAPELRLQCLACDIRRIDALLYTHHHADHIVGLDDVRRFNHLIGGPMPVYASAFTMERVRRAFEYAFYDDPTYPSAKPQLEPRIIRDPFRLFGRTIVPLEYMHGPLRVLGFRVGAIAYVPDCSAIPPATRERMAGLDVLVLDALRRTPHPTHFTLDQAVAEARRIGARRTIFTHMAHELGHAATNADLPPGMELGYDGMVLESET